MKGKILILIIIMFLISGCTAEVNIEIDRNKINESTNITVYENVVYPKEVLRTSFRNYIPIYADDVIVDTLPDQAYPDIIYYQKKETDLGNGYLFNYSYNFNIDEYKEARTIKDSFKSYNVSFNNREETLRLSTDNEGIIYFNDYPQLEEVRINIKTDYLVKEHNADRIDDDTYTWIFTKDSKNSINMLIDLSDAATTNVLRLDRNEEIIILSVIGIIFIICLFLIFKNKKNNKI